MKFYLSYMCLFLVCFSQAQTSISMSQTFKQFAEQGVTKFDMTKSARPMISYNEKQDAEGSPYLFDAWAKGTVLLKDNTTLSETTYILNFDKTRNTLLMKVDAQRVLEVDMSQIAGFTLIHDMDTLSLISFPENSQMYLLQLYKDSLYSLYKTLNTKFLKSDYVNKGLYETGYKYDRYVDENTYYIMQKDGRYFTVNAANKAELRKIADVFPSIKAYFKEHSLPKEKANNDTFFINLTRYLNKKA